MQMFNNGINFRLNSQFRLNNSELPAAEEKDDKNDKNQGEQNVAVQPTKVELPLKDVIAFMEYNAVHFALNTRESFQVVFDEMRKNVPDRTTTIEEKELALKYIDRLLACEDIPNPEYWQNKKSIIEMEIQRIKNDEKLATGGETVAEVHKEFIEFTNKYFEHNQNLSFEDMFENRITYYTTYMQFCLRFLACEDVTEEQRADFMEMLRSADRDIHNWELEYNKYKNNI